MSELRILREPILELQRLLICNPVNNQDIGRVRDWIVVALKLIDRRLTEIDGRGKKLEKTVGFEPINDTVVNLKLDSEKDAIRDAALDEAVIMARSCMLRCPFTTTVNHDSGIETAIAAIERLKGKE